MHKLDKLDWKILGILDWNGREPVSKIAKAVGSSKDVVAYRIKKLEENGVITNYFPILDMHKLGYNTFRLYFELEELNEAEKNNFNEFLDKEINAGLIFWHDYQPYTCGIFLWDKSIYDVEKAITRIKSELGKKFVKYNFTVISTFRQYPKDYLFGKKFHEKHYSLEPNPKIDYDESDFKILKELAKNARLSTVEIAKRLGIPQTTVSNKIKNLEKNGIIMGYRAQIDLSKIDCVNYFLEIYLNTNENFNEIESWANSNKNVVWLQKVIGTCDLEIEVEARDKNEFKKLLDELRSKFKNIRKIVFWSQEYRKLTFLP